MTAQSAISRYRRDVTLGAALRGLLFAAAVLGVVFGPQLAPAFDRAVIIAVIAGVWLYLSARGVKGARLAAGSPSLIAAGQYEEAERQIEQALRSFSMFRTAKLLSLHHLALLRHAQRRWGEAALLCRALLGQRLGTLDSLNRPARLMLAESSLELGDTRAAGEAIAGLYAQRLSLVEGMKLLRVQLDYLARVGAWDQIIPPVPMTPGAPGPADAAWAALVTRVQLAELMPPPDAARTQAYLALAALKVGRPDWSDWLRRRVELLADIDKLAAERPVLWELWGRAAEAPSPQ